MQDVIFALACPHPCGGQDFATRPAGADLHGLPVTIPAPDLALHRRVLVGGHGVRPAWAAHDEYSRWDAIAEQGLGHDGGFG